MMELTGLCAALEGEKHSRVAASGALRELIDEITLDLQEDQFQITLKGNLAGMLVWRADMARGRRTPTTSLTKSD